MKYNYHTNNINGDIFHCCPACPALYIPQYTNKQIASIYLQLAKASYENNKKQKKNTAKSAALQECSVSSSNINLCKVYLHFVRDILAILHRIFLTCH